MVFGSGLPKFRLAPVSAPQTSPPVALVFCAAELSRLQSTMRLPFESVHGRLAVLT